VIENIGAKDETEPGRTATVPGDGGAAGVNSSDLV
jgi:hypothetical protein